MSIKLKDMLKKAEEKGYSPTLISGKKKEIDKPWKHGSILFNIELENRLQKREIISYEKEKLNKQNIYNKQTVDKRK